MRYYLDLFSGIGGFRLGAELAGIKFDKYYFSEVDKYAISIYQKRFPGAIPLGDIKKADYSELPKGDWLVSGGFPCQPHSVAGKKRASQDERDLWPECRRMLRELRPRAAVFENVPGLAVSERGRFFNRVLSEIHESGYDAEWMPISAADAGARHLRNRIWIICSERGGKGFVWNTHRVNENTQREISERPPP
jgi:DNA (cytosine-5)-methyltransferase 1